MAVQANPPSYPAELLNNLNVAPVTIDASGGNVDAMVAEMIGENSKLSKEAQPTKEKQNLAYIQQALSQSINSTDFAANMQFWGSLKDSLAKDSPLLPFVTAQLNLFANNSDLKNLQAQLTKDTQSLQDELSKLQKVQNSVNDIQNKINAINNQISALQNEMNNTPWYDFTVFIRDGLTIAGLGIELGGLYAALEVDKNVAEPIAKLIYNTSGLQTQVTADTTAVASEKNIINAQSKNLNLASGDTASSVLNLAQQANNTAQSETKQAEGIGELFAELTKLTASKA